MGEVLATIDEALSPPQAVHLDQVCDCFETAWKNARPGGPRPRIEDFLVDTREPERSLLLQQLLLLEIDYRRLRGESPAAEEYGSRFPGLSSQFLIEAFPPPPAAEVEGGERVALPVFSPQVRSGRYVVRQFHALAHSSTVGTSARSLRSRR